MTSQDMKPRFVPEITLGGIIQIAMIAGTILVWSVKSDTKADQTQRDLQSFQGNVAAQFTDLKGTLGSQITGVRTEVTSVRTDIALLPDYKARLEQVERRLQENATHNSEQDLRLGAVERTAIQVRSDLDGIIRASGGSVPGTRAR